MGEIVDTVGWRLILERARDKAVNHNTASFVQLATFDPKLGAQVRTLVFRGFADDGESLLMATDGQSAKLTQVRHDKRSQIVWYLVDARQQFRFSGELVSVGHATRDQVERLALWRSLSYATRSSFFANTLGELEGDVNAKVLSDGAPESFVMLKLVVTEVDHLDLNLNPHQRHRYVRERAHWKIERIGLND